MTSTKNYQKWVAFAGVMCMVIAGLGIANCSLALWTVPMSEALNVPRSVLTTYDTVGKITGVVLSLLFAPIYKRLKPKGMVVLSFISYTLLFLLFSHAKSMPAVLLGGFFNGVGWTFSGTMAIFAILPTWFPNNIGLMSGIAASTIGILSSFVTQVVAGWIESSGYVVAQQKCIYVIAVLYVLAFFLVKASPDDPICGVETLKAQKENPSLKKKSVGGFGYYKETLTNPIKVMGLVMYFMIGVLGIITVAIVPAAEARGAIALGTLAYSIHYLVLVPGKIGVGFLRDKIGVNKLNFILFPCALLSLVVIGFCPVSWYPAVGVLWGLGTVLNQIWPPYVMMEALGEKYDSGFAAIGIALFQLGYAIGSPAIHIAYDKTGSYSPSCIIWGVGFIALWALATAIIKKGKKAQLAEATAAAVETVGNT